MRYYLLRIDWNLNKPWCLGDIHHVDNWLFLNPPPEFMEPCTYTLDVKEDGVELDYTEAGYAGVPIISETVKNALIGLSEIDEPYYHTVIEPININNKEVQKNYFAMIIETQVHCVDETKSDFQKFEVNDPVRPDLAGEYRGFLNLVIDPSKIKDRHIFRLGNSITRIIVSEEVKNRFEAAGVIGATFDSVNGDKQTVA